MICSLFFDQSVADQSAMELNLNDGPTDRWINRTESDGTARMSLLRMN